MNHYYEFYLISLSADSQNAIIQPEFSQGVAARPEIAIAKPFEPDPDHTGVGTGALSQLFCGFPVLLTPI
jgi:hypothetical protein